MFLFNEKYKITQLINNFNLYSFLEFLLFCTFEHFFEYLNLRVKIASKINVFVCFFQLYFWTQRPSPAYGGRPIRTDRTLMQRGWVKRSKDNVIIYYVY